MFGPVESFECSIAGEKFGSLARFGTRLYCFGLTTSKKDREKPYMEYFVKIICIVGLSVTLTEMRGAVRDVNVKRSGCLLLKQNVA